jgi:hypothetical protein
MSRDRARVVGCFQRGGVVLGPDSTIRVAGIDWATEPTKRALVELRVESAIGRTFVERIVSPVTDDHIALESHNAALTAIGVDVPFGWPTPFAHFVAGWSVGEPCSSSIPTRDAFSYRTTDLVVREMVRKTPLSVSSDRIALGAFAWAKLVAKHGFRAQIDCGAGPSSRTWPTIIEVYPAATLTALSASGRLEIASYKSDEGVRASLLVALCDRFRIECSPSDLETLASSGDDSDKTDAFVAALTTAMYAGSLKPGVARPSENQRDTARREGWIFFPDGRS